jgi:hypothetical protein
VCVCVCGCVREEKVRGFIHAYVFVCKSVAGVRLYAFVRACVCERERERARERERECTRT